MARVVVLPNSERPSGSFSGPVLLDECVEAVHLENEHSSLQFIERVTWAIRDAERVEVASQ
ncbi:MAG TPA: hypothetical protein VKG38_17205 [Solirubrobacteraceae bacterium]|nr:hypothetical protein [Solirubrobacteraceae bacterium]